MVKGVVKVLVVLFSAFFFACSSSNSKPIMIDFSADRSVIVFNHINQTGLLQLQSVPDNDTILNNLISVTQTPSEQDSILKEVTVNGKVLVSDSNLVFIPDRPFVKGRDYLISTYLNTRFGNVESMLKGEIKYRVKPLQKLLTR